MNDVLVSIGNKKQLIDATTTGMFLSSYGGTEERPGRSRIFIRKDCKSSAQTFFHELTHMAVFMKGGSKFNFPSKGFQSKFFPAIRSMIDRSIKEDGGRGISVYVFRNRVPESEKVAEIVAYETIAGISSSYKLREFPAGTFSEAFQRVTNLELSREHMETLEKAVSQWLNLQNKRGISPLGDESIWDWMSVRHHFQYCNTMKQIRKEEIRKMFGHDQDECCVLIDDDDYYD